MTKDELRAAAKRGAALLDAFFPDGWMDRIDQETLDMDIFESCIIGQVFGDNAPMDSTRERLVELGISNVPTIGGEVSSLSAMSMPYGFWPETTDDSYYDMEDAWLELLNA